MSKASSQQQIIIVLWKWDNLTKINANALSEADFEAHIADIEKGKGLYYEELAVEESPICKNPLLVRVNIYNDNNQTQRLFLAVLQLYIRPVNEVMLFLHRANFYGEKEVGEFRKMFSDASLKCFLFSEARDFIYYSTKNAGFLNETGGFYAQREPSSGEFIRTFDRDSKKVKQPYFDRVWQYYRDEFQSKVFMLKQELFDAWFPLMLPNQPEIIAKSLLIARLNEQKERALIERVNSFLGLYIQEEADSKAHDDAQLDQQYAIKTALNKIAQLERNEGKSYLFDDAVANFQYDSDGSETTLYTIYQSVKRSMTEILFQGKGDTGKTNMRVLAQEFNTLIKALPGDIS